MSTQKGNASRTRSQKYKNQFAFKNNLHDTSHITKKINEIEITNVCERCKGKLEWRIKFKKYKLLKMPSKCTKCLQKVVKHSYNIMCQPCAIENGCCPNCGIEGSFVKPITINKTEQNKLMQEYNYLLKGLSERERRTFLRKTQKDKDDLEDMIGQLKRIVLNKTNDNTEDFDDFDDLGECSAEEVL